MYTDRLLDVFFLLLVVISELHEKPSRKDRVTKKVYRRKMTFRFNFLMTEVPYHKETSPLIYRANY